ncbi:MAG: NAD-dependent epimerase/dehydratase family protein, partial [Bradymonadaceae bacterium]
MTDTSDLRVFVTGGTGFVGSHVVDRLVEAGHSPLCLIRETSDTSHLDELGVDTYTGSLGAVEDLRPALEQADAVVHIAGIVKAREPEDFYDINGEATVALAELAAEVGGFRRFVYLSSIAAQGPGFRPDVEAREPAPVSHYGRSKLLGEEGVQEVAGELPVSIFRPPPVYGPRDHEMFKIFQGAARGVVPVYGDGESVTSVVHVFDLADAVVRSLEREHPSGAVFPIDDGNHYSWNELAKHFGRPFGGEPFTVGVPPFLFSVGARLNEWRGTLTGRAVIFTRDKLAELEQDAWVCGH